MKTINAPDERDEFDDRPSKSQLKRDMIALQKLGVQLVELGPDQLKRIDLPEDLRAAVVEARRITAHEGRRRQLQYIGKLMRTVDPEPIRASIEDLDGVSRRTVELMHRCERWRDRLIDDDAALTEWLAAYPQSDIDVQPLRALIRAARRERTNNAPPKHARELYRWLNDVLKQADA
jgi:ribosome-associated protein